MRLESAGTRETSLILAALCMGFFASACSGGNGTESIDLIDQLAFAEAWTETERIDFGSESAAGFLLEGWESVLEPDDRDYVWGMGASSSLRIRVIEPGDRTLVIRVLPFSFPSAPTQTLSASINGRSLGSVALETRPAEYSWELPAALLRTGENRLTFSYAYHRAPTDVLVDSADARPLAVAWDELRLEGSRSAEVPRLADGSEGTELLLPIGGQVDYFLDLRPGARFRARASGSTGLDSRHLVVEFALDRADTVVSKTVAVGGAGAQIEVGLGEDVGFEGGPARLSLRSVLPEGEGALRLLEPRVEMPRRVAAPTPEKAVPWDAVRPSVLIYLVDTLRADRLGTYGSRRGLTPKLDEFARGATVFVDARANTSWTRPAVATILTGLAPWQHGVNQVDAPLPAGLPTLAEILGRAGYQTAGFITNLNVSRDVGFGRGFDTFQQFPEDIESRPVHAQAGRLHASVVEWLDSRDRSAPFFVYVHATDPHGPYTPEEPYRSRFAGSVSDPDVGSLERLGELGRFRTTLTPGIERELGALYDAEVAYFDHEFGSLLETLDERGLRDGTLLVFISDHGEEFYEHGWWEHGKTLHAEQLRVPLIIAFPNRLGSGDRRRELAQQIDVVPTILEAAGIARLPSLKGRSLLRPIPAGSVRTARALLSRDQREVDSLEMNGFKLIEYGRYAHPLGSPPRLHLYDTENDPGETRNLADARPVLTGYLRAQLRQERLRDGSAQAPSTALSPEQREQLRALGYVD